jgi:hypothetical protein
MGGSEAQLFFLRAASCHQYAIHMIQKCIGGVNQTVDDEAAAIAAKVKKKRKPKVCNLISYCPRKRSRRLHRKIQKIKILR